MLFKSAHELLTNAVKHGHPNRVRLDLRRVGRDLRLEVADDGVGFDPARARGGGSERGTGRIRPVQHPRAVAVIWAVAWKCARRPARERRSRCCLPAPTEGPA